jgi:prepilin-type N-terminal cleavage/methylation domain-containing protein
MQPRKGDRMTSHIPNRHSGFTLLELSIVLVIIGLITGGILAGKSLIRSAELQNVTKEHTQWTTAHNAFELKYNAMPGDLDIATQYFNSTGDDCATDDQVGVCNGNRSGRMGEYEATSYWIHLSKSGLIPGNYSGAHEVEPGVDLPASAAGGAWSVLSADYVLSYVLADHTSWSDGNQDGIFTPEEAWQIDAKVDDGMPREGNMHAGELSGGACAILESGQRVYALTNKDPVCPVYFLMGITTSVGSPPDGWTFDIVDG